MGKSKQAALAIAGLTSVMAVGQPIASAATYTVQQGDTLTALAKKFNVSVDEIVNTNNIADRNLIFVDQKLEVSEVATTNTADIQAQAEAAAERLADEAIAQAVETEVKAEAEVVETEAKPEAEKAVEVEVKAEAPKAVEVELSTPAPAPVAPQRQVTPPAPIVSNGSVYDQFIAAGGSAAMWHAIVMPESGGNPNAVSPTGFRGLGQTKEAWGMGSVAQQTQGMLNYAVSRYGSVQGALAFRAANGWW